MQIRFFAYYMTLILAAVPLWAAAPANPGADFTLSNSQRIPGDTLQPGSYSIHVVNRLSDRVILKVDSKNGSQHDTFIGVQNSKIEKPASSGPVKWSNAVDGTDYLRGWYFPGTSSVVEFVYPKTDAVAIAKSNPAKVPAIDPASEGKVADNTLSKDDMQVLTLWLLSLQSVGTGDQSSSIKAERYQQVASVSQKPVISALPHTASRLPWIWLVSFSSLLAAAMLRVFRVQRQSADFARKPSRQE